MSENVKAVRFRFNRPSLLQHSAPAKLLQKADFVTPRKRVKKPKVISTCDTVMFLDTAELSLMVVYTQHMHNVLLLQALVALLIIKIIVVMSRRSQSSIR